VPEDVVRSTANPLVKRLVRLRQRRAREREGVALVEGARELVRAVEAGWPLELLVRCPELYSVEAQASAALLEGTARALRTFTRGPFERASLREGPDGLLGLATPRVTTLDTLRWPERGMYLVLAGLEKPGNVGALVRTAAAAGVAAVFLTGRGADPWNPNAIRSSMGSVFTVPIVVVDDDELGAALRSRRVQVVATAPAGAVMHWDADLTRPTALVVGGEHEGLEARWLDGADVVVRIPMRSSVDSLNAGVAGAVVLYEAVRQRGVRTAGAPPPSRP
jgi:RNA methyltransferase, TrmH family